MRKPAQRLSDYFSVSEKEANGFIILSGIMLLFLAFPYWYRIFYQQYRATESQLVLISTTDASNCSDESSSFFPFDPNTASKEDLSTLGLPVALAQRIEKYRNAGGKFKVKSDLKKIYGFPEEVYDRLYEFIQLPDSIVVIKKTPLKEPLYTSKIDINRATARELQRLKGIGPVLSGRIVKYRDLLGGYVSIDQLEDVYGIQTETLDKVKSQLFVATDFLPKQINLHNNPYHPYLTSQQRKCLSTIRKKHPDISGGALFDSCQFSAEDRKRINPYWQPD